MKHYKILITMKNGEVEDIDPFISMNKDGMVLTVWNGAYGYDFGIDEVMKIEFEEI